MSECYLQGTHDGGMKLLWSPSGKPAAFSGANGRKNLLDAVLQAVREAASASAPSGTSSKRLCTCVADASDTSASDSEFALGAVNVSPNSAWCP